MYKDTRKLTITMLILAGGLIGTYFFFKQPPTNKRANIANIPLTIQIKRLENILFSLKNKADISTFLEDNQVLSNEFLGIATKQDKDKVIDQLYAMVQDNSLQTLYNEVQHKFKDLSSLTKQLEYAFKCLKYYYPSFVVPEVVTLITGFGSDLYVSERLIVIGLDYFLGEGATFRPNNLPDYILRTYAPSYIAPKIILLLSQLFNAGNTTDQTLLQDMIYYGKACYFTKVLLPDVPEAIILGYTPDQWTDTKDHQRIVWQHFIDHELFYKTNHMIKKKYLDDRPFTSEIGPGCPGNIGGWLGWQIVNKYMNNNPELDLTTLMQTTDAQHIFREAKYKPR